MSYRRRHRWFRRMALGLAFSLAMFAGFASVASAKFAEGANGVNYVTAGDWSGAVDPESGIPLSAGIPHGDEQFVDGQGVQVVPYLSHGLLTEADVQAAAAGAIQDPFLTDVFVRPGESLGGPDGVAPASPDGDAIAFANALESQQPTVIPYLSHGILGEDVKSRPVASARPDDLANRFAHSDVAPRPELASSGSTIEWNEALTVGIGALVLTLALGLAVGYLRRPRLAGM